MNTKTKKSAKMLVLTCLMAINAHTAFAETTEYFDPQTGEFSSHPPEGTEFITRTQQNEPTQEPKEVLSPLPGGGVSVEVPEVHHDNN